MSQTQNLAQKQLWILVSAASENTKDEDLANIAPQVLSMIDGWVKNNKFILSGPFDGENGGLAIFEGTESEAKAFSEQYGRICGGLINFHLYKWNAMWGSI
jgi:hypothetical protein